MDPKKAKNATHNAKQFNLPLFIYLITLVIVIAVVVGGLCPESSEIRRQHPTATAAAAVTIDGVPLRGLGLVWHWNWG